MSAIQLLEWFDIDYKSDQIGKNSNEKMNLISETIVTLDERCLRLPEDYSVKFIIVPCFVEVRKKKNSLEYTKRLWTANWKRFLRW